MARQSTHPTRPKPEKYPRRDPTASGQRDAAINRIASHNYFLLEKFETGIALTGTEVKSVLAGESQGFVWVGEGRRTLASQRHISPYEHGNSNHSPLRTRKLLIHRDEIEN